MVVVLQQCTIEAIFCSVRLFYGWRAYRSSHWLGVVLWSLIYILWHAGKITLQPRMCDFREWIVLHGKALWFDFVVFILVVWEYIQRHCTATEVLRR